VAFKSSTTGGMKVGPTEEKKRKKGNLFPEYKSASPELPDGLF
jgi:hypothetical protein